MSARYQIPPRKRFMPWIAGIVVAALVWQLLLHLADASGAFSFYVALLVGFNAYAFVAAGIARPAEEEEDEGFFLTPNGA